jgi:hypothetical protein
VELKKKEQTELSSHVESSRVSIRKKKEGRNRIHMQGIPRL